jgi:pyridoxal phosphate enzyme (YggS family)
VSSLAENIQKVRERIHAACGRVGRDPQEVLLLAVTKIVPLERIREAFDLGLTHFGENYVQEAKGKIEALRLGTWHFIGHLQKNKAKQAVGLFSMIETVDGLALARELNRRAKEAGKTLDILIQVNEAGEETKSGLAPDQVPPLLEESPSWSNVRLRGLMCIPPYDPDPERSRPWFRSLFRLRRRWQEEFPHLDLSHLSMGMSHDFEVAIEEGATIVRIGTSLFGPRR